VLLELEAGGARLRLLPQRAVYLPEHDTLLVADAHVGKAVSFRRLGVPVPGGTTDETLHRLGAALQLCGARHIVFLGDLLHSARARAASTLAAVARWRDANAALGLTLVRGNHDSHAGDPPADWGVRCVDEPLALAGLALCHHPMARPGSYVLAGHVHPSAVLGGRAFERLRLPCFHFGPDVGVLPAFGEFTGTHALPRGPQDRVYVSTGQVVRELPPTRARTAADRPP
jgi:DNA ligase-associated metallophosphoesterase